MRNHFVAFLVAAALTALLLHSDPSVGTKIRSMSSTSGFLFT